MLVRKKDWNTLLARVEEIENYNRILISYNGELSGGFRDLQKTEDQIARLKDDYYRLRNSLFGVLSRLKSSFSEYHIYSQDEMDKMSSEEYKDKVLKPLLQETR